MFMMLKMPAACLLLSLYSFYYYKKNRKMHTYAAAVFEGMMYCLLLNLTADAVTEYTVNYRDRVPELLNYVWHVIFLLTLASMCFLLDYYLIACVERGLEKKLKVERKAAGIGWAVCSAAILALPIEYIDTQYGSYSLGPKAYALYGGVLCAFALLIYQLVKYRGKIEKSKHNVLALSIVIFLVVALVQMAFPYLLITGLGMTMIVMGLLLTAEDSNSYLDKKSGLFNESGFQDLVWEQIRQGRPYEVLTYVYIGDAAQVGETIRKAAADMETRYGWQGALLAENMVAFLPILTAFGRKKEALPGKLPSYVESQGTVQEYCVKLGFTPEGSVEEVLAELRRFRGQQEEELLYRDKMSGAYNRNAYERDVKQAVANRVPIWYVLVDINHLKSVNDTYGHAVGDGQIQAMALLLTQVFAQHGRVYRVGGDEFAVICGKEAIEDLIGELEQRKEQWNQSRELPISYALGYARYEPEKDGWEETAYRADMGMYRDKVKSRRA